MARVRRTDIHDHDRQLKAVLGGIKINPKISEGNRRILRRFHRRLMSDNLSLPRGIFYLNRLSMMATWIRKDFDKATRRDIEKVMNNILCKKCGWTLSRAGDVNLDEKEADEILDALAKDPEGAKLIAKTLAKLRWARKLKDI